MVQWICTFAYVSVSASVYICVNLNFLFAHPMTRYDPSRAGRSGNKSEQSSNPKASEGLYKIILSTHYLVVGGLPHPFHLFNSSALSYFSLSDCKKSPPIIPGISSTPGTMIYAGSIGTQIANELLDFNRYVLDIITLQTHKSSICIYALVTWCCCR